MSGFLSGRTSLTTVQTADIADDAITEAKMATDAIGITELKAGTDGNIISFDSSGDPVYIATGNDGQVLTSAGAGAQPAFEAVGGGLTFISSTDISSAATYAFTAVDASSYDGYGFFFQNVIPVTDAVFLWMRTSSNGGSSYDAGSSDYNWSAAALGTYKYDVASAEIGLTSNHAATSHQVGSATNESGVSGWVWLCGPHLTGYTMVSWELATFPADGYANNMNGCGIRLENADVDACQFLFSSGSIESGTINAFGVANA